MKSLFCLSVLIVGASAFPQAENGCGEDERGILRQPGDSWQEDCNRCRCLAAGVPGCTKKFCGGFPSLFEPESKACLDSLGNSRQEGEKWEKSADICSCGQGVVVCTALTTVTDVKRDSTVILTTDGVNFPDNNNQVREASSIDQESTAAPALFTSAQKDVTQTAQCRQAGITNCQAVNINLEYLETAVKPGDSIRFIQGHQLSMKLRRAPSGSPSSTMSYSFSLSDGGEGTVTVRPNKGSRAGPSVFASIRPVTGSVIFSVEACGQGCNVLYERNIEFFNQFED
eukprot:TRINITY_DN7257_c0_g1_i1.p1 TRINITY_DN7257_c0_g1~~TRINITY_DN7257_c0_g1_i1.p1  ORF type:complete len:285 (-),score=91.12 TRINITY_DN7257_c0_g1_i1:50-904(-)